MLILLPPSEAKTAPRRGGVLRPDTWPVDLAQPREEVIAALIGLCQGDATKAAEVLGLGPSQADEVRRNAILLSAHTARADRVYSGVLYEALDLATLSKNARRRASSWLRITSGLFGAVSPTEPIPAYRLGGGVSLPGIGPLASYWRGRLGPVVTAAAGSGLVVDLRSSTYAGFWRPTPQQARRVVTVRVLHEIDGRRSIVSHFNKATKGRLVRAMLQDDRVAGTPGALANQLTDLGWMVERDGSQLDVIVPTL
ncbi:MAG: YaaA family protein [Nocardioidaceae bacterium]